MNIFLSGLPYYFVTMLLLKHLGFSFTEIASLSVITELCDSVFDIPLSVISSKFGYKKILVISNFLLILALSCLLFGKSNIIYISAISFGLSESLSSGVLNAYNFEIIDDEVVYKSFLKYLNTIKYVFEVEVLESETNLDILVKGWKSVARDPRLRLFISANLFEIFSNTIWVSSIILVFVTELLNKTESY